jgi:hypothetical protein
LRCVQLADQIGCLSGRSDLIGAVIAWSAAFGEEDGYGG